MTLESSHNSSFSQKKSDEILQFFCRHLVALNLTFQHLDDNKMPIGKIKFDAFPGIIINIRGLFFYLMAGHALQGLVTALHQRKAILHNSVLADTFGSNTISPKPIPFDFLNAPKYYINNEEEGLDFGVIFLHEHYVQLLSKNGIVAIFEENWISQHRVEFHNYAMLGLPEEFISAIHEGSDQNLKTIGSVSPTLIFIEKSTEPPKQIKSTKFPRFIGQLNKNINSIVGMSGGPIFGFNNDPPMRYWIIAIQSSWIKNRKITFGCPIPVLANFLTDWVKDLNEGPA